MRSDAMAAAAEPDLEAEYRAAHESAVLFERRQPAPSEAVT